MTKFGGNQFINCLVPFVFLNRYFLMEPGKTPLFSVLLDYGDDPIFEVYKNEPRDNPFTKVTKTTPGIITVSEKESGKFLYKIRPISETSVVFGTIGENELTATIRDKETRIGGIVLSNNSIIDCAVGVLVHRNGSVSIGGGMLPPVVQRVLNAR